MRRRSRITAVNLLQIGLAVVLIVVLVLLVFWYSKQLISHETEEEMFRYVAGVKFEYSENAVLSKKDGVMEIEDDGVVQEMGTAPLISSTRRKITLPNNMMLITPAQGMRISRLNSFTELVDEGAGIEIYSDGKSGFTLGGFLFDGDNTYVFLDKTKLTIGAREIELEPLSYVTVYYRQSMEYYNIADDEFQWIGISDTDIIAEAETGYKLDLGRDIIDLGQGESILYSAVDSVPVLPLE